MMLFERNGRTHTFTIRGGPALWEGGIERLQGALKGARGSTLFRSLVAVWIARRSVHGLAIEQPCEVRLQARSDLVPKRYWLFGETAIRAGVERAFREIAHKCGFWIDLSVDPSLRY
jgi:hypothetical protein